MVSSDRPRRAPEREERGRAAERTRERILRAAVAEFGAKGYSGARTAGIAARAGVNQQLISYYFGGKRGLLDELRRRWAAEQAAVAAPGATYVESVAAHLDATLDRPDWARLVIWQALGDGRPPGGEDGQAAGGADGQAAAHEDGPAAGDGEGQATGGGDDWEEARRARLRDAVERTRRRQEAGEITGELDAEFLLLLAYALTFAPIALPRVVEDVFGVDPLSREYRERILGQLAKLAAPRPVRP
ncbi:TetR family transcriptional regulator [Microbispora sp. ATCC PTA-5024]|uniref:TetR family transcriptional regulator n=1 Tax=Microbispora sp. ATCC PTA-5024 TaxID=316330 RepID=UPI000569A2CE|nr:TetR family transcriptional regulator [Microbispora sp. ATCC PTA-5024]